MNVDLPRASAFAVLVVAVAGYAFVFRPLEATAGDLYAQIDVARATLDRSVAMTRRIPALEADRSDLATQVARLHTGDGRAATVDRFLRSVAAVAEHDGVVVEGVAAGAGAGAPPASATSAPALLEAIPFDLTLRGPYSDVIRAVRDLNDRDGAVRIGVESLSNAQRRPGGTPQLNAAFHVLLLREAPEQPNHDVRPQ